VNLSRVVVCLSQQALPKTDPYGGRRRGVREHSEGENQASINVVNTDISPDPAQNQAGSLSRETTELFLISLIILFMELACIRWFPAHVLFLTFFTNTVLLSSFLGMSVGCLAASHKRNYLAWTPVLLVLALAAAHFIELTSGTFVKFVDVGHQESPQLVFFGTEYHIPDFARLYIPIEVLCGFFFVVIALAFIGPGQKLGSALTRMPNRVHAYTFNIVGSLAGILLFAACSWLQLSPFWWFSIVSVGLSYFYFGSRMHRFSRRLSAQGLTAVAALLVVIWLGSYVPTHNQYEGQRDAQQIWSPYYRIDFKRSDLSLSVNLIYHQQMVSRSEVFPAYALPHILNRDAGKAPFRDVMIIGAGSGNDVSRALQWGATSVDAVEIDPAIYRLGVAYHPDHPYQDPRVHIHLDDGRNFLRSAPGKYDLIVYALVDSLVLHSGYSNIRLESYLFTRQTFEDVRGHLKPGGQFVIYNYFRQGWIVGRLRQELEEVFGVGNPLALTLPYHEVIEPDKATFGDFTVFFSGDTDGLRDAFNTRAEYWLRSDESPGASSPNGFLFPGLEERWKFSQLALQEPEKSPWQKFGVTRILMPQGELRSATDDWPFLYLREPTIPTLNLRGAAIMGTLAILLILLFLPRDPTVKGRWRFNGLMFFLGAGFMLIETKAVVLMALLFGSTWVVNSVVFFAVLLMILAANLWTLKVKPDRLWPYYAGLFVTLALNAAVPLDYFLGLNRSVQVGGSCLLVFAPVFFAGVIFALSFKKEAQPDLAFGANIAGATLGGLAEYSSMLLGFQYLVIVAMLFYALSAIYSRSGTTVSDA
jgi:spermidine synthase